MEPRHSLLFCLVVLVEWVIELHLMCYFSQWYYGSIYVEPWYLSSRRPLLCVLCNKASSKVWHICGFLLVLWFNITHTRTHACTHTYKANRGLIDWHTQIDIYQHHLFCSHTSYPELYWMNNLLISKIYFLWFSKITRLWK